MRISKQQAKSLARLGLRHVCRLEVVSDAELVRLVESIGADLSLSSLLEAVMSHASASKVIDIGRATWRARLERLANDSLTLQYQLSGSRAKVGAF